MVLSGVIRVQKMNPQGHEILLYRVEEGQSCILTTACMIGHKAYPAEGIVEHDVDLILISPENFNDTMAKSEVFREFVMSNISLRICDLMLLLEDVAFGRMDIRLAKLLIRNTSESHGKHILTCTHQNIATELGTAREVISRLLKSLEKQKLLHLDRNKITILDLKGIKSIANATQ